MTRMTRDPGCPTGYWRDRRGRLRPLKFYRGRPATWTDGKVKIGRAS